ncbi:hypothetical protein EDC04DRAFT_2662821, partial [Pisolithus marmoratus]
YDAYLKNALIFVCFLFRSTNCCRCPWNSRRCFSKSSVTCELMSVNCKHACLSCLHRIRVSVREISGSGLHSSSDSTLIMLLSFSAISWCT